MKTKGLLTSTKNIQRSPLNLIHNPLALKQSYSLLLTTKQPLPVSCMNLWHIINPTITTAHLDCTINRKWVLCRRLSPGTSLSQYFSICTPFLSIKEWNGNVFLPFCLLFAALRTTLQYLSSYSNRAPKVREIDICLGRIKHDPLVQQKFLFQLVQLSKSGASNPVRINIDSTTCFPVDRE